MARQLLTIQVARGVAANLVVLAHLYFMDHKYTGGHLPASCLYGMAGVDVFFVLSGFIMTAVAGRATGAGEFLFRRAVRIYPAYWIVSLVVLAVAMVFPGVVNASASQETSVWKSLLLFPQAGTPILAVGWTLVHEMYFYLVFALMLLLRVSVPAGIAIWLAIMGLGNWLVPEQMLAASPVLGVALSPLTLEFMLGAAVGLAYLHLPMRGALAAVIAAFVLLCCGLDFSSGAKQIVEYADMATWRVLFFGVPAALAVYALAAWEKRGVPRPWRWLVTLGDWSYATYLVHVLVLSALGRVVAVILAPSVAATMLFVMAGFVAANVAGAAMTVWIERPLRERIARWRRRPSRSPLEPGADAGLVARP